jgi:AbrB family looped-hinge helix DNA binding protein
LPGHPTVAVTKVQQKGLVQLPLEVRERLDLKPGTKMIVVMMEDAVVLQKAESVFSKERPIGVMERLRSIFSRVPISDIEQ